MLQTLRLSGELQLVIAKAPKVCALSAKCPAQLECRCCYATTAFHATQISKLLAETERFHCQKSTASKERPQRRSPWRHAMH